MKTLEEQIAELQDRLNKLENNLTERSEEFEPCCVAECDCGCDEPETETNEDAGVRIVFEDGSKIDLETYFESGFDKLEKEFERIEIYSKMGHLATYEQAIEYQKWKETKNLLK